MAQRPARPGGGGPGTLRSGASVRGGAGDPFAMLSFTGGGDLGGGDDDADLDDPELLAELAALSGGSVEAAAPAPAPAPRSVVGHGAAAMGAMRAPHALGDDADDANGGHDDHELHTELAALSGGGGSNVGESAGDDVDLLDFGAASIGGGSAADYSGLDGSAAVYGGGGSASASASGSASSRVPAPAPATAAKVAPAPAARAPAPAPAPPPPKPAAPALPAATVAAIERYRTLAEGVRQKALAARSAGSTSGRGKGTAAPSAAAADTPASLLPAAHWLAEYKGLQDELAQLAAGVPVADVEAATAARRARAARDRGYNELRHALYSYYKARIAEGTSLAATLRTPGLPREERADLKRRYDAVVADKRVMETALNRLDGCYKHPSAPPPPAWAWVVTTETRCDTDDGVAPDQLLVAVRAVRGLANGTHPLTPGVAVPEPDAPWAPPSKAAVAAVAPLQFKLLTASHARDAELTVTLVLPLPPEAPSVLRVGPFRIDTGRMDSDEGQPLLPPHAGEAAAVGGEAGTPAAAAAAAPGKPPRSPVAPAAAVAAVPGALTRLAGVLKRAPAPAAGGAASPAGAGPGSLPISRAAQRSLERRPALVEVSRTVAGGFLGMSRVTAVVARGAVSLEAMLSAGSVTITVPLWPPHLLPPAVPASITGGGDGVGAALASPPVALLPPALIAGFGGAPAVASAGAAEASRQRRSSSGSGAGAASATAPGPCGMLTLSLRAHAPARDPALRTTERRVPTVTAWPATDATKPVVPAGVATAAPATPGGGIGGGSAAAPPAASAAAAVAAPTATSLPPVPPLDFDDDGDGAAAAAASSLCGADDLGYYVSFDAINTEVERVTAEAGRLRGLPPSPAAADALADAEGRAAMLQAAAATLQLRVESGGLSLEDYLALVKAALARDLAAARELKARGRLAAAAFVIARAKVMSAEVKGAEGAQAAE